MTKRCIAIGGIPGTGKTTLMMKFLEELPELKEFRKLIKGHEYEDFIVLGDYARDGVFKGTDTFSMAVQPEAEKFFDENQKSVIFEGDRIFNTKMLSYIEKAGYELLVIILKTDHQLMKKRYEDRGSDQDEKFINGRKTKYENIEKSGMFKAVSHCHNIPEDTDIICHGIWEFLLNGTVSEAFDEIKIESLDDFFTNDF